MLSRLCLNSVSTVSTLSLTSNALVSFHLIYLLVNSLLPFFPFPTQGMSMGGGFGLAALMGFVWTPVHTVLPFVILGLGVDDSFVIVNALNQQPRR